MEQTNTNLPESQLDVDWTSEVRYPDVPQSTTQEQLTVTASAEPPAAAPVTVSTTPPAPGQPVVIQSASPYYHLSYDALRGDDFPGIKTGPLDMENHQSQEVMANPTSNAEVYAGSLKSLLARNLGYYVVATFQMSGQGTVSVPGILYTVGNDYIVLYQPENGRYVTGDLYALKFVDFHETQSVPRTNNQ